MSWRVALGVVVIVLLGCKQFATDGSTAKSSTPQSSAARAGTETPAARDGVPAPTSATFMPHAVGQWIKHRLTDAQGHTSELTYSILSKEGNAFWVEMDNVAPGRKDTVFQFLLEIPDLQKPETLKIHRVKMKMNGRVQELSGPMLSMIQQQYGAVVRQLAIPKIDTNAQATVQVPAGKFHGCYKQEGRTSVMGIEVDSVTYFHPSVPINAVVRMTSRRDKTEMVLLAYGTTGAQSRLE